MQIIKDAQRIKELLSEYDWQEAFNYADFSSEDVLEIHDMAEGENDGLDWIIYGVLLSGQWFFLSAGCDYTGWDCQANGYSYTNDSKDDLIRFDMTEEARVRFGIILDDSAI